MGARVSAIFPGIFSFHASYPLKSEVSYCKLWTASQTYKHFSEEPQEILNIFVDEF